MTDHTDTAGDNPATPNTDNGDDVDGDSTLDDPVTAYRRARQRAEIGRHLDDETVEQMADAIALYRKARSRWNIH